MKISRYIPQGYTQYAPEIGDYKPDLFACYIKTDEAPKFAHQKYSAIFYKGKSAKASWHYSFKELGQMEKKINDSISSLMAWEDRKVTRKEERKTENDDIKVGDLFAYSWGYDQTNVDFFQCVEKKNKQFTIREIASKQSEKPSGHYMSAYVRPVRNAFLSDKKPIKKMSIMMPFGILSKTDEKKDHYSSWYA